MKQSAHTARRAAAAFLLVCILAASFIQLPVSADGAVVPDPVTIAEDTRSYPWLEYSSGTYVYDFTKTDIVTYSQDSKLATVSLRTNMVFADGKLSCKAGKTFSFGSAVFLGDDYGFSGGDLSFRLALTGGSLALGARLQKKAASAGQLGLWFTFTPTELTVSEPKSGLSVRIPYAFPDGETTVMLEDRVETLTLRVGDAVVCSVGYTAVSGALTVYGADGKVMGSIASTGLNPAGYFTLWADDFGGSVDDLVFSHTDVSDKTALPGNRAVDYSSWVATDDRGRTTPTADETGSVREGKQVGLFYFLCWTGEDDHETPQDVTAKYLELGLDGLKSYLADPDNAGGYYWAEPYFGYYKSIDTWVYRKHAYMLEAAGVDFIFLDMTNGASYPDALLALFDTWLEMRHEGISTPDICVFTNEKTDADMATLRGNIYSDAGWEKYSELFYMYKGKPLILANKNSCSDETRAFLEEKFTVRNCWAWRNEVGSWSWLQEYRIVDGEVKLVNGGLGTNEDGEFEQLALCVGHHPTTSKGRSYANTVFPKVDNDFGFSLDSGAGTGFEAQFEAVMKLDPDMVMITGWNEWIAGLNQNGEKNATFAGTKTGQGYYMVDLFNTEYSRDAEPMRLRQGDTVGFGDNYYYQMVSMIRKYKGFTAAAEASGQGTINITEADEWQSVGPDYCDNVGDTELRHEQGFYNNTVYVNNTGRNDLDTAKVSQDAEYLYFTVTCVNDIVTDTGSNWMNLFLNTDGKSDTGWEGYDFVINRARDSHYVSIESLADGWDGRAVGQALYTVSGNRMTVRVSKAALGLAGEVSSFLFKWADNSTKTGSVMEFMDLGDTAPDGRFAYLYEGKAGDSRSLTYTLPDGVLRDETSPLPGMTNAGKTDTATDADTEAESAADSETAAKEETTEAGAERVLKHSFFLKGTIVMTGFVLGLCAYALITVPDWSKKSGKGKGKDTE
jgi:hypothetical protein